ncbi:MFS transporter [Heyndrickxia sporothermodurans]
MKEAYFHKNDRKVMKAIRFFTFNHLQEKFLSKEREKRRLQLQNNNKGYNRRYVNILFFAQFISTFASTFGTFTVSWLVYDLTGSKMAMGGLWFITIFGQILVQLFAGPFIDRWKRTTMMKCSEGLRFLIYFATFIMWISGHISVGVLYAVSFLGSFSVYDSAANALVPKLVSAENLVKINAKISGYVQLVRFLSLPIAGFITAQIGRTSGLAFILLLFIVSLVLLYFIEEEESKVKGKQTWINQFTLGIRIYSKYKILVLLGLFVSSTSFGVFATQAMYIPYVSERLGGSSFEYSLFAAAFPFGYIIGTYMIGRLKEPKNKIYLVMVAALFIGGCTYIGLGITRNLLIALLIEVLAGICMPFWNVYSTTLYQRLIPETVLGQVLSVRFLLTKAVTPLGIVYGTFSATTFSLPFLFISVGFIICFVSGIGFLYLYSYSNDLTKMKMTQ